MYPHDGHGGTPRGHGLADLKGLDPMDRRLEVEKKERYARELRDQMNSRCNTPQRGADQASPVPRSTSTHSGLAGVGSSVLNLRPSMGKSDSSSNLDKPGNSRAYGSGQPHFSSEGPPSETGSSRSSPYMGSGLPPRADGGSESWGTAGKVAQLQDMIRDRLKYLEEQQQKQWERLHSLGGPEIKMVAEATAREAVEHAMRNHLESLQQRQRDDLKRMTEETREAVRASLAPEIQRLGQQLEAQGAEMGRMRSECHEEVKRLGQQLEAQAAELAKSRKQCEDIGSMRADIADLQRRLEKHQETLHHLERTKADRSELRDGLQEKENALNEIRRDQAELRQDSESRARELSHLKQAIALLRDELAEAQRRQPVKVREEPRPAPPPPEPRPPSPSPAYKKAPKETYVILKGVDDNVHYLVDLENIIGRAATCNVMVGKSQSISGQHASIQVSSSGAILRDLGSRNGTWINERRVGPHEGLKLESGDSIQLGVDGPCYLFGWGPAAAKILPRDYEGARHKMAPSRR